jgi:hypothetical protein
VSARRPYKTQNPAPERASRTLPQPVGPYIDPHSVSGFPKYTQARTPVSTRAPARSGHAALSHGHSTHGGGVCGRHQDKVYRGATAEEAREGWSWGESVLRVMLLCVDGWLPVNTHRPRSLLYDGVSRRPVPLWWVLLASVMYHLSYASSRSSSCPLYQCSSVREQRERRYRLRHRVVNRSGRARCALFEEIFRYRSLTHRPLARRSKIRAPTRRHPDDEAEAGFTNVPSNHRKAPPPEPLLSRESPNRPSFHCCR